MRAPEPYAARQVRFLELWEHEGWRMKVYGIAHRGLRPEPALVETGKQLARTTLPHPPTAEGRYGVGFIGVHAGRDANLVFVDWWANENELYHRVFTATLDRPREFERVTGTGLAGCVWDLAVIGFERRAWIAAVLSRPDPLGLNAYLAAHFEGRV